MPSWYLGLPLCLALWCSLTDLSRAERPRDRSEKNAVRGLTGDFDGIGFVLWISRDQAQQLLPKNPDLRLDYPGGGQRYPIVLLLGAQQDVGVQFGRGYVHPRFLKHYENAYVIVPYLRHPALASYGYTFSRIYVSDERIVEDGTKLNHSPKVHAEIEDQSDRFVINFEGQRRIDLAIRERPTTGNLAGGATEGNVREASSRNSGNPPSTPDFLREVFKQPKIEFSPNPHVFDFDFMAEASAVRPVEVSGTIILQPAAGSAAGAADIAALAPGHQVEAIHFSSHWTKKPE
ncbi:MAG TPA: hypothetical protein VGY55_00200 [Pirellulales bacterium]|nr:hypothetical protein [Pirellulales bacterium]